MDSTSHHCGEFVIVTEHSKSNNSREQNKDRAQHINDKGDTQEKKLKDKGYGFPSFHEIVNFLKKIDKDINGNKGCSHNKESADKLSQNIAIKK